jgi:hypothetical protein
MQLALFALALVGLIFAGCQGSSTPTVPSSRSALEGDGALAAAALERGDYAKAVELYERALTAGPDILALHYGLGVSASYFGQRQLAVRELRWVLEHGEAGSNEVKEARRWLLSAGALPHPEFSDSTVSDADESRGQARAKQQQLGAVHGRAMSGDTPATAMPMARMQLILKESQPPGVNYFRLRTDEQGYFRFQDVPPGVYQLTERIAGQPTWRLRVDVRPGADLNLDLTPENSTKVRDDFPDLTTSAGVRAP